MTFDEIGFPRPRGRESCSNVSASLGSSHLSTPIDLQPLMASDKIAPPTRPLGPTDIHVTPIGLGTWQFSQNILSGAGNWGSLSPDDINAIVQAALDGGVNWFDTAEIYGFGRSERNLARALRAAGVQSGEVVIATKWWPIPRFAGSIPRTIDKRIKNLAPYPIDLHQVHWPYALSSIESIMDRMAELVQAGKVKAVGVSNYNAEQMRRAHACLAQHGIPLTSNQVKYNLLDRRIEANGVLETAQELGITIIAYSPLEMGLLTGKFHQKPELLNSRPRRRRGKLKARLDVTRPLIDRMAELAEKYDATVTQIGLNWLIHAYGDRVIAIPGATKPHHAADAARAMNFVLSLDEIEELHAIARALTGYKPISN